MDMDNGVGLPEGLGGLGGGGQRGETWNNCNSINNKYNLKSSHLSQQKVAHVVDKQMKF